MKNGHYARMLAKAIGSNILVERAKAQGKARRKMNRVWFKKIVTDGTHRIQAAPQRNAAHQSFPIGKNAHLALRHRRRLVRV